MPLTLTMRGSKRAELLIYATIGETFFEDGVTVGEVKSRLDEAGAVDVLDVRINSYGGDVFAGTAIHRLLMESKAKIIVHVDGLAASIASVIAMAGDEIHISKGGFVMIHEAKGIAFGSADDFLVQAERLRATNAVMAQVYVDRTGNSAPKVADWMRAETWFNADEALAAGFATHVEENLKVAACYVPPFAHFAHVPAALQPPSNVDRPLANAARKRVNDEITRQAMQRIASQARRPRL